jgi:hypothetical protein
VEIHRLPPSHLLRRRIQLPNPITYCDGSLFGVLLSSSVASSRHLKVAAQASIAALRGLASGLKQFKERVKEAIAKAKFALVCEAETREGYVRTAARSLFVSSSGAVGFEKKLGGLDDESVSNVSEVRVISFPFVNGNVTNGIPYLAREGAIEEAERVRQCGYAKVWPKDLRLQV